MPATAPSGPARYRPTTGVVPATGLRYLRSGAGPPLVLLHGWGSFKEVWWRTARRLGRERTVVAFDWPGHGSPSLDPAAPVLETLAELTVASCRALGLDRVALAGHSLGGNVAVRVAVAAPTLVERLVLVNPAADAAHLTAATGLLAHPTFGRPALHLNRYLAWPLAALGARVPDEHAGGLWRPLARRQRRFARVPVDVLHAYLRALRDGSLGELAAAVSQPTLVVVGARDPLVRPAGAGKLARQIPNARLRVLPDAYHCPMDETAVAFERVLAGFLAEPPAADSRA